MNQKKNSRSLGRNTSMPITTEVSAAINTAPAAMSFTKPALGLKSGETKSTRNSMAVLNNSDTNTKPIAKASHIHSAIDTFNQKAEAITNAAAIR